MDATRKGNPGRVRRTHRGREEDAVAKTRKLKSVKLDLEKAEEWLDDHWKGDQVCPVCGNDDWVIIDEVVEMRAYSEGQPVISGSIYPHMAVICVKCGNTLLFNALLAGLVEQPE